MNVVFREGALEGLAEVLPGEAGELLEKGEGDLNLLSAEAVLGLEADCVADDCADYFDHGERLGGDGEVKEGVGDVSEITIAGVKPIELLWISGVLVTVVPAKFIEGRYGPLARALWAAGPDAGDEAGFNGLVDGLGDASAADGGIPDEVVVGDDDLGVLRVTISIAPAKGFADHVGDQADHAAGRVGKNHVEELVRRVGRVAGWWWIPFEGFFRSHKCGF